MNLQENIFRIKEMMGLVSEQNLTLPYVVTDSHTGKDCDSLHGFQLSSNNANMMGKVKTVLDNFKNQGVWVSDVKVIVNGMTVNWEVTIDKSSDGEFWNGFTSRGAGCDDNIQTRWNSESVGNGVQSIITKITSPPKDGGKPICDSVKAIELVKKVEFTNLGGNSFVQGFYRYKCDGITEIDSNYSQLNKPTNQKIIKKILHNNDPDKLRTELKGLGVIYNADIISRPEEVIVKYQKTGDNPVSLSFIYSDSGEEEIVLDKVKESNDIERKIDYKINEFDGYIIVIKKEID